MIMFFSHFLTHLFVLFCLSSVNDITHRIKKKYITYALVMNFAYLFSVVVCWFFFNPISPKETRIFVYLIIESIVIESLYGGYTTTTTTKKKTEFERFLSFFLVISNPNRRTLKFFFITNFKI